MFLNLEDAKSFLGIEDSDSDNEIEKLIKDSEILLGSLLGYKNTTMELQTFTRWVFFSIEENALIIPEYNIKKINTISGVEYTGIENIDFIKDGYKKIIFLKPVDKEIINHKILVEYEAGFIFEDFPEELRLALKIILSGLWNTKENIGIKSCKVGQESSTYKDLLDQEELMQIINNFKKQPNITIF